MNYIASGTALYSPVDAVATKKYSNAVYKISSGGHLTVTSSGDIEINHFDDIFFRMASSVKSKWVTKNEGPFKSKSDIKRQKAFKQTFFGAEWLGGETRKPSPGLMSEALKWGYL